LAFLLLLLLVTTFLSKEIEMVFDWLTAVGIVLASAAAFGILAVARADRLARQSKGTALPPRFRTLAAGDVRDYLQQTCLTELPRRRASDHVAAG
jgi:hypothetical protein